MKRLLILITTIFLLSLSFASAQNTYDLEVTSLSISGNTVANSNIVFNITIKNNNGFYNASDYPTNISLLFGDGNNAIINLPNKNLATSEVEYIISNPKQYTTKGTYQINATLIAATNNDTNSTNNNNSLSLTIDNSAPVITDIPNQEVFLGKNFSYPVSATDADDADVNSLEYYVNSPTLGTNIVINSTGVISYDNAQIYGNHEVSVIVGDGTINSTKTFYLNVRADVPGFELNTDEIQLGDSNSKRGDQVQEQFTINNTGTQTINKFTVNNDLSSDYDTIISFDSTTPLLPGQLRTGIIFVNIPVDQDSERQVIGELTVKGEATTMNITKQADISLQAESLLEIKNIEIKTENDEDTRVSNGDTVNFLKEGDEINLVVTVKNNYNSNPDIDYDIENVYVKVEPSRNDWFDDEKSDSYDISPEDEKDIPLTIKLNDDMNQDDSTIKFKVFGRDREDDFYHYDEWEVTFEIQREKHEVTIKSAEIVDSYRYGGDKDIQAVSCEQKDAVISVNIKNTGIYNEDAIMVRVNSPSSDLDFSRTKNNIELNDSESDSYTFTFNIPEDLKVDDLYTYTVSTYYDGDKDSDEESYIVKYVCDSNQNEKETIISPVVKEDENQSTTSIIDLNQDDLTSMIHSKPKGKFSAFRGSDTYLVVLTIVIVILLIATIYLGSIAISKK